MSVLSVYAQCLLRRVDVNLSVAITRSSLFARKFAIIKSAAENVCGVVESMSSDGNARKRFIVLVRRIRCFLGLRRAGSLVSPIRYDSTRCAKSSCSRTSRIIRKYVNIATESPSDDSRSEGYSNCRRKRALKVSRREARIREDGL